jgi:hypothetical protein
MDYLDQNEFPSFFKVEKEGREEIPEESDFEAEQGAKGGQRL